MEGIEAREGNRSSALPGGVLGSVTQLWAGMVERALPWMETVAGRSGDQGLESLAGRPRLGVLRAMGEPASDSISVRDARRMELVETERPAESLEAGAGRVEAGRVESGLAGAGSAGVGLAGLIHDARNMVTAIELYCDLLDAPGVLTEGCRHYAGELRTVSAASCRLLERLAGMECAARRGEQVSGQAAAVGPRLVYSAGQPSPLQFSGLLLGPREPSWEAGTDSIGVGVHEPHEPADTFPALARPGRMRGFAGEPILSLAGEIEANRSLLAAVAGHGITVGIAATGGNRPVEMTREDLARVLVNLARNAAEAMPDGGHLQVALEEMDEMDEAMRLSFSDTGSGMAPEVVERIFLPGYTTHVPVGAEDASGEEDGLDADGLAAEPWPVPHRGLGLAIVRSLVSDAGGRVWAANREDGRGAVFTVEFPLRKRGEGKR